MKKAKRRTRPAVKTYPATINGRKVRVTIPEDPTTEEALHDAIREHLTPKALAAVAGFLYAAPATKDESVNRQVRWLADFLFEMVEVDYEHFVEELGL